MAVLEAKVKLEVKKLLKKYGAYYYMAPGGPYGVAGTPDFLCCVNGKFIAIETKVAGKKATPIQVIKLTNIATANGIAMIITELDYSVLEDILKHVSQK